MSGSATRGYGMLTADHVSWLGSRVPPASTQTAAQLWIDPVNGRDNNDGRTSGKAVRSNYEACKRTTGYPITVPALDIRYVSYPPVTDPLRLDIKLNQRQDAGPVVNIYGPTLPTTAQGTFSAVTNRVRSSATPYMVTDGTVSTVSDVGKRIRIVGGARDGAHAWVAKSPGAGQRRTSEWAQYGSQIFTVPVTPQVGDAYVVQPVTGGLYTDFIRIQPGTGMPFPTYCAVTFNDVDLHTLTANAFTPIENRGAGLTFNNCAFLDGEWGIWTLLFSGDFISGFTAFENCHAAGIGNIHIFAGTFLDNYFDAGLYNGNVTARAGGGASLDFDMLCQGPTFCQVGCVEGGQLAIGALGVMDVAGGGVIINDGTVGCNANTLSGIGGAIWGSLSSGQGVDVRDNSELRYTDYTKLTITGPGGNFTVGGSSSAWAFDEATGLWSTGIACTWAALNTTLKHNAQRPTTRSIVHLNRGSAQP